MPTRMRENDAREGRSDARKGTVAFARKPRVTIGPDGPRISFKLVNRGDVSVDVGFTVKVDGRSIEIVKPGLSLDAGSGRQAVTLDLPIDRDLARSADVSVSVTDGAGNTLTVGHGSVGLSSTLLVKAGVALAATASVAAPLIPSGPELGTGDVQVTLEWTAPVDLDLHVTDPSGGEIFFGSPTSPSGGALDVDACRAGCEPGDHVENVFWPEGEAPAGDYATWVTHYAGAEAADYTLRIRVDGEPDRTITGTVAPDEDSGRTVFDR